MNEREFKALAPGEGDVMVAEAGGSSLIPQRERAMCTVAARHISVTGDPFLLDDGSEISCPPGEQLSDPYDGAPWNSRYLYYIAQHKADEWVQEIDAVRDIPKPFTTSIAHAWEKVEEMGLEGWNLMLMREQARDGIGMAYANFYRPGTFDPDYIRALTEGATASTESLAISTAYLKAKGEIE